ncbi:DUF4007 family protein [Methylocaldum sp. BRCS4]|jgi:hypothetical protein|uniref:DUF4007 family protein n=1 Tax=Methylocaldum sp. 14B TaxID=1912213 RepID=UPI00098A6518|nr:DUF4007 family protein [Methylocaldum sp. 14B]MVF23128.1 DUF4007 family protein [Methylocaldum sp. BRCS4]
MARGPLYQDTYSPQFSGHETFPLRYGWLKKVYDRVSETEHNANNRSACWDDDAIARFGVGKNMVGSMRHWAKTVGIIEEPQGTNSVRTTRLGHMLFGPERLDPYLENPSTLWLIHWQIAAHPEKTTWFWAFSHFPAVTFERESLTKKLERLAKERNWSRASNATIKNDVACFIRTYVARQPSGKTGHDDALESPLTELGLIKAIGKRDGFRFVRGPKSTLGHGVFVYALMDFWLRYSNATTLSFEAIAHEPGGPGRVFAFEENDVADRLAALDEETAGALRWSETAGLKQVVRNIDISEDTKFSYLQMDYAEHAGREAA